MILFLALRCAWAEGAGAAGEYWVNNIENVNPAALQSWHAEFSL